MSIDHSPYPQETSIVEIVAILVRHRRQIALTTVASGVAALALSFAFTPKFTSTFTMLPPPQQQGLAAALLGSLTGGIPGAAVLGGLKNPADQWISLIESRTIADRLIDKFDLLNRYDVKFRFEAAKALDRATEIVSGKDGIITVAVSDEDPKVAQAMAAEYMQAISDLNDRMALTEAAQRRAFFEKQQKDATAALARAQAELVKSGVPVSAIKADPGAAVSAVAEIRAQVAANEVNLQVARQRFSDTSPEVQSLQKTVSALRGQLAQLERSETNSTPGNYIDALREFKYRESVFEVLSKQYELARLDEAREGSIVQFIDTAQVPEWKSFPKRSLFAALGTALGLCLSIAWVFLRSVASSVRELNRSALPGA